MENYCYNICNFFNNLCGYMEKEEINELLKIIGNDMIEFELTDTDIDIINDYVLVDNGKEFYKYLRNILIRGV